MTSQKLVDLLCPHLSPAWYQLASSSSLLLGRTDLTGKVDWTGTPVNLKNLLKGDLNSSTPLLPVGGLGVSGTSWSKAEDSSETKEVPEMDAREEEGAGLGGRKKVGLVEVRY